MCRKCTDQYVLQVSRTPGPVGVISSQSTKQRHDQVSWVTMTNSILISEKTPARGERETLKRLSIPKNAWTDSTLGAWELRVEN